MWAKTVLLILFTGGIFVLAENRFSSTFQSCLVYEANKEPNPENAAVQLWGLAEPQIICTIRLVDRHNGFFAALGALAIAIFTGTLWQTSNQQAFLTREALIVNKEALIVSKRALVFAKDIRSLWEIDKTSGEYVWRFRPIWENTGDTPTSKLRFYSDCELRNSALPPGFDFTRKKYRSGVGLIPPRTITLGGVAPPIPFAAISPQDILDVRQGSKFLYIWGWASCFDTFPDTKEHITRFCWMIHTVGDPRKYVEAQSQTEAGALRFETIHHSEGNGFDEDTIPQPD
jgi:hypothetical protein